MKLSARLGITGLLLTSTSVFAILPAEGWYAGFMAGGSYAPSKEFSIIHSTTTAFPVFNALPNPIRGKVNYNIDGNGALQLGYRCDKVRFEGEVVYNNNSISKIEFPGLLVDSRVVDAPRPFSIKGYTRFVGGVFNVFYEFYDSENDNTHLVPYVGAGLGYAYLQNQIEYYNNNTLDSKTKNSPSSGAPLGQAMLGLNYFFTENVSAAIDMRYMVTRNISKFNAQYSVGTLNLLVNFSFDQPSY